MKHAVALDIGGTSIKYALVAESGKIVYESAKPAKSTDVGYALTDQLKIIIGEVINFASSANLGVCGIGIGVPSVIDNGVVLFANNLPELDNKNLRDIIHEHFPIPVFVDNDANMMGLGEVRYGFAHNISDAVFLTIGTGIGGALILNGKLYGGYHNRGTELGHIIVNCNGNACSCGAKGCLEAHASVNALIEEYKSLLHRDKQYENTQIEGKYIVSQYLNKEKIAVVAMENHFHYLAVGVISLINVFAPQKVIIGGGISESGDFYIKKIRSLVEKQVMKETSCYTTIERASLGNKAGFLGAAAMVFSNISKL